MSEKKETSCRPSWWRSPRTLLRSLLQLNDTPHSIALGSAIGMWIALTPTVGIQMIEVMIFAFLTAPFFKWNRIAALLMVYVSNPVTMIPLYWFNYRIGRLFVDGSVTYDDFRQVFSPTAEASAWHRVKELMVDLGGPLLVGSLVVCTVSALLTYPAVLWLFRRFHGPHVARRPSPQSHPVSGLAEATAGAGGDAHRHSDRHAS